MSRFHNRNFELLEPYDAKVSCTVLRGERGSNTPDLPDKKYYDALKSVNNLVKDGIKVKNTILMIGEISDIYVTNFQLMLRDENYTAEELSAIAFGYTKLLEESNNVLKEMKEVVNITTLSMTDKERMDVVDRCYNRVRNYRNLVMYYTNKNISVSYLRAKKKNDMDRVLALYGSRSERYW
ncbi:conjugal transfer protein TraI [Parabacteroides faecis]|uniref:conjugal transfer protein TraI n=1 Tax=Parabacteroides faecis TaxID=1217282 RepID=UPI002164E5A2|nr:conjugal transfer protein TraI [Parabacteroides faecis]MCS2889904.1 conjugal transfer protein TraI [Parabacteroides faecis]UVQ46397.1 conjugal transfer protein TraI [Parabacteroides faecis]